VKVGSFAHLQESKKRAQESLFGSANFAWDIEFSRAYIEPILDGVGR